MLPKKVDEKFKILQLYKIQTNEWLENWLKNFKLQIALFIMKNLKFVVGTNGDKK